ncbi:ABC transporter permease [Aureimonas psammosilenae]|uniref:ABC transporter permease n=1 Tax=Aureimonas psammosilenae TaxID=2495496 RepID=UPI001F49135B|nr:iron ABC transporter permease [Aureimonas psammosilenae]
MAALAAAVPLVALVAIAFSGGGDSRWGIVGDTAGRTGGTTLILMLGVAVSTAAIGTVTAWLTTSFDFPGRRVLSSALVLPLAVPTYIAAYCFTEFLHATGPVQTAIRDLFGFRTSREYWFPDIRSLGGAIAILSLVLYPYVFLTVRALLAVQGRSIREAAAILGAGEFQSFWRVLVPLARPAVATGVALVLMETVNDIGAVEALGVRTTTFAIYSTWLNGNDLQGATRIAMAMLVFVLLLVFVERFARRKQAFASSGSDRQGASPVQLRGAKAAGAALLCTLPVLGGFGIPFYVLADYSSRRLSLLLEPALWDALRNTVMVAGAAGVVAVIIALCTIFAVRLTGSGPLRFLSRMASVGYAIPGTVLAIGLLVPLAAFDNALDAWMRANLGTSTGLLLSGSGFAVVYAASARFAAMSQGAVENGFASLPPSLDMAARGFGCSATRMLREIFLPLLRPALVTAFLLVFVETAKELSATILLRPFGFETLATYVYAQASRAAFEDGALAALLIVLAGILPVALLRRTVDPPSRL